MGLNDTAEQLDVCRQQSLIDEARIRELEKELADAAQLLARIAALAQNARAERRTPNGFGLFLEGVEEALGGVAPGVVRPQVGTEFTPGHSMNVVRPVPPQSIDRDDLLAILDDTLPGAGRIRTEQAADWILALVRPVAGVTLTPEEYVPALRAISDYLAANPAVPESLPFRDRLIAVAARLEAAL